jgi:excinuclease ABC subunit B
LMVSESNSPKEIKKLIKQLEKEMFDSVKKLEFEKAALLRDQINFLKDGTIPSKNKNAPKKYGRKKR